MGESETIGAVLACDGAGTPKITFNAHTAVNRTNTNGTSSTTENAKPPTQINGENYVVESNKMDVLKSPSNQPAVPSEYTWNPETEEGTKKIHHPKKRSSSPMVPGSKRETDNRRTSSPIRLGKGNGHNRLRSTNSGGRGGGPRLSWKSDQKASFCDWRIEVHHLPEGSDHGGKYSDDAIETEHTKMDVYNLHRNIVGFGPRKSNFLMKEFCRQMESRDYKQGANITKIFLPPYQAEAFPLVLDYIYYTKEVKQTLTAQRACAVFKIAELLDVPPLREAIAEFYQQTLSLKNMTDFVTAATKANADRLIFISRAKIGGLIFEKPELAGLVMPSVMVGILQLNTQQLQELQSKNPQRYPEKLKLSQSRMWSKVAYVCASHNHTVITKEQFEAMAHEDCLPAIDVSVAYNMLMLDARFSPNNTEYTSLQKRCVKSILDDWEAFHKSFNSPDAVPDDLQKLPSHVLTDILMKSMNR